MKSIESNGMCRVLGGVDIWVKIVWEVSGLVVVGFWFFGEFVKNVNLGK